LISPVEAQPAETVVQRVLLSFPKMSGAERISGVAAHDAFLHFSYFTLAAIPPPLAVSLDVSPFTADYFARIIIWSCLISTSYNIV